MSAAIIGAVAATLAVPAAATGAPATPGAPGIGDAYFPEYGNGGYDVAKYDINVDYAPTTGILTGDTTLTARATQDLTRFNLDLVIKATEVTVNGQPAKISQKGQELTVTPKKWLRAGATFTVAVKYAGDPAKTLIGGNSSWYLTPTGGAIVVNEPESSVWWYPSNDHPRDKAKFSVTATVPAGLQAISNGLPVAEPTTRANKTTWKWAESDPRATYLSVLAIGKYDIVNSRSPLGKPSIVAVEKGAPDAANAKKALARTGLISKWLQNQLGTYQFDAVGGIAHNAKPGFALETQTRPAYSARSFKSGANDSLIVHEMAHQWFGDSVSVTNWRDIWLNEGYASFASWLWSEQHGLGDAQDIFDSTYAEIPADDPFWKVRIGDPGAANLFDGAVYDRGAMTVQALRNRMGDPKFFRLLRTWTASHANGNGQIKDFTELANQISGKNLDKFFQTWLYTDTRPAATPENGFPVNSAAVKGTKPNVPKSYPEIKKNRQLHEQG